MFSNHACPCGSVCSSVGTGSKVMASAAQGIRNCTLELGGKSAMIIFDVCDGALGVFVSRDLETRAGGKIWRSSGHIRCKSMSYKMRDKCKCKKREGRKERGCLVTLGLTIFFHEL